MSSVRSRFGRSVSVFAVSVVAMATVIIAAPQAQAAVGPFTLTALSWDDIGLDSNDVTTGPNVYEIGIRACNTGVTTAPTVTATWTWTNIGRTRTGVAIASPPGPYVAIQTGTSATQVIHGLAGGACFDFYFNMEIVRNAAAYKTTRNYTVTVDDGAGVTATRSSRIAIMDIQSQNRNYVLGTHCDGQPDGTKNCGIYGSWNGTGWNAAPTNVLVGSTYTYTLISTTATAGYGSYSTMLNFPRGIFQIQSVVQTYKTYPNPPNAYCCQDNPPNQVGTVTRLWNNACNWQYDATDPVNDNCTTGVEQNDKSGNTTVTTFTIKILAAGTSSITGLVWDGSGASWHYNSDYGTQVVSITATMPWAARFEGAQAVGTPEGDDVSWQTGYESDNLGFNVYAADGNSRVKVNSGIVAGSAFGPAAALDAGGKYQWLVPPNKASPSGEYWIESIDTSGKSDMFGPVRVDGSTSALPRSSATLASLAAAESRTTSVPRAASGRGDPVMAAALAQGPAAKISVDHEGWYHVSLADLAAAGVDISNPSDLHLYAEGVEQPAMLRDGGLEFYGIGLDTPSTGTRVYWVTAGSTPGLSIPTVAPGDGSPTLDSFPATVERRDRNIYFATLLNGDGNNFFGAPVTGAGTDQNLEISHIADPSGATVDVGLQGVTSGPHAVAVSLNGNPLGNVSFKDSEHGAASFPATGLVEGTNTLRLTSAGPLDISLVDAIDIHYTRTLTAEGDALRFTAPAGSQVTVDGFSSDQIRVADVTDASAPTEITGSVAPDGGGGFQSTFTVPGAGTRTLYAFAGAASPLSVEANIVSHLRSPANKADMLIIAPSSMMAAVQPLAALHQSEGLRTSIVDVADVYDEFGGGEKGPQPIKDLLTYAHTKWRVAPRFVLLAGDASVDPRNFIGRGSSDLVPTAILDTRSIESASDNWLADAGGDLRPDVAVGRLPADTPAQMDAMVAKTLAYVHSAPSSGVVVPFDGGTDFNYAAAADAAIKKIPSRMSVQRISGSDPNAHQRMIDAFDAGPSIVNYIGHGSIDLWRGGLFQSSDANALTNTGHPAFLVSMTCLNGYFIDQGLDSVSEAMLKAPGGAVAAWASSAYTYPEDQRALSDGLYGSLFSSARPTVGQAVRTALKRSNNTDDLKSWILFGDPAVRIR